MTKILFGEERGMASFVAEAIDQIRESTPSTWDKKHDAHVRRTKERSEILYVFELSSSSFRALARPFAKTKPKKITQEKQMGYTVETPWILENRKVQYVEK